MLAGKGEDQRIKRGVEYKLNERDQHKIKAEFSRV